MAKLTMLKSRLSTLPDRFGGGGPRDEKARSQVRRKTEPWLRWYNTARWQKLRAEVLLKDRFTCRMCRKLEPDTSRLVADHIVPHRGDEKLFWNGELQCLCQSCHSKRKQAEERSMPSGIWY